jgi:hypothetical protein
MTFPEMPFFLPSPNSPVRTTMKTHYRCQGNFQGRMREDALPISMAEHGPQKVVVDELLSSLRLDGGGLHVNCHENPML